MDPVRRVFLHVGAPKTGTTFLQQVLWRNRRALARAGVCYPLEWPGEHLHAALDLRKMPWAGRRDPQWEGAWERLAERARAWDGHTTVISNELLGGASEQRTREAVASLGPAQVHVVLTARDLARQIPSGWQEHLKHQHPVTLDEFCEDLFARGVDGRYGRMFWSLHDLGDVLRRWRTAVPPDRIHVITVPQPGAGTGSLWERFAGVVGVDAGRYKTQVRRDNASVGVAEAELLRRLNAALDHRLPPEHYDPIVRRQLAETVLAGRPDKTRIVLPQQRYPEVLEHTKRVVADIESAGYEVIGDLSDLVPPPPDDDPASRRPEGVDPAEVLDATVDAVAGLALRMKALRERSGAVAGQTPRAVAAKRVVRDLSEQHASVMRMRKIWWRAAERTRRMRPPRARWVRPGRNPTPPEGTPNTTER